MSRYRDDQGLLFQIENPRNLETEIQEARGIIREYITGNPSDKKISVAFSLGKDSLLTAVLVAEVLDELNDPRPIYLSVFYSGDEKKTSAAWFAYLRASMSPRFIFRICSPPYKPQLSSLRFR